jgi:hypothetical protein
LWQRIRNKREREYAKREGKGKWEKEKNEPQCSHMVVNVKNWYICRYYKPILLDKQGE